MKACLLRAPAAMETNPLKYAEVAAPQPKSGEVARMRGVAPALPMLPVHWV